MCVETPPWRLGGRTRCINYAKRLSRGRIASQSALIGLWAAQTKVDPHKQTLLGQEHRARILVCWLEVDEVETTDLANSREKENSQWPLAESLNTPGAVEGFSHRGILYFSYKGSNALCHNIFFCLRNSVKMAWHVTHPCLH
jgi:hypothetical protein